MRKILLISIALLLSLQAKVRADEGMWLLSLIQQVNMDEMTELGLELTAEQIYSVNNASLKDAVGALDYGSCTAELVSPDGLLLTNHHCGYGEIQFHSSLENDYLKDGFWAMSRDEELPNEGKSISFLVRMEEVTDRVLAGVNDDMSPDERLAAVRKVAAEISDEATDGTHYEAQVRPMFKGNRYFLFVLETYLDVRLVGAPPESIGKFGADTDNWMWPRHTGDFSLFRVYADKDNKPAEYSKDNVPYQPKHHLPISLKGVEKNDFAMILGYPGGTQRYMTSWEIDERVNVTNANRIYIRGIRQELMLEDMLEDDEVRIKYSSKYSGSTNYWKNSIGMNKALKQLKIYEEKLEEEKAFMDWVNENPERKEKYGDALSLIEKSVENRKDYIYVTQYISETLLRGTEIISLASRLSRYEDGLKAEDEEKVKETVEKIKNMARNFYKDYNAPTDQKIAKAMFKTFAENVDEKYQPEVFETIASKYKNDYAKYIDKMFSKSVLTDSTELWDFLEKPSVKKLQKDPAYSAAQSINKKYRSLYQKISPLYADYDKGHRLYVQGIMEMKEGEALYPDANFTMRLTYGEVQDYYPRDAVHYDYITTLTGVMEKEDPDNWEFVVHDKLKELYKTKDYGRYAMETGEMPVAFISTNDITGGNSGSPVINGKGHLIGTAFDGNWEAMSGDIVFEPELQRCINVDARYILFVIDKFAGAKNLIEEMTIIE